MPSPFLLFFSLPLLAPTPGFSFFRSQMRPDVLVQDQSKKGHGVSGSWAGACLSLSRADVGSPRSASALGSKDPLDNPCFPGGEGLERSIFSSPLILL